MRPSLFRFFISYSFALTAFLLFFPLKFAGAYRFVIYYPAQGEEQMSANFDRLVFILPPFLSIAAAMFAIVMDNLLHKSRFPFAPSKIRGAVSCLAAFFLLATLAATRSADPDAAQILIFMPLLYLANLALVWLALFITYRVRSRRSETA